MHTVRTAALALALLLAAGAPAFAWGASGHRFVSGAAAATLPDSVPAFLRSPDAQNEIAQLGPEPDRLKGSGKTRDADLDPGHFLDLADDLTIGGAVALGALPQTRDQYDGALRDAHGSPYVLGYLPYSIVEGWLLVRKDLAIWRADVAGERTAPTDADRAYFTADRHLRETLTLRDIGYWSHFVGDGSQPLHVSVHYNGWGDYPNPKGYTQATTTHAFFEGAFVRAHASLAAVSARVPAYHSGSIAVPAQVADYLKATNAQVVPFYELESRGAFANATADGIDFTLARLAAGATELRDLIAQAWEDSANATVGYPAVAVRDIESGKVQVTRALLGGSD
jgi:hypothetical protein